jgi:dTMP kinase
MTDVPARWLGRGLFVTFEGAEGSGKSTQMRLLAERLRAEGYRVTENQEPGATRIGTKVRQILLDPAHGEMAPMTELLLMFASRAQAAAEIIQPALNRGDIVLSDRFTDSSLAYQGGGRELGFEIVWQAHALTLDTLKPDVTFYIKLDLATGLERAHKRNQDTAAENSEERIDRLSYKFHERVEQAYMTIATSEPQRFRVVDGSGDAATVAGLIWAELQSFLPPRQMKE